MSGWANPNNFTAVFRLTNLKYAEAFLDKGSIKFNTPQSWIDYSRKYGDGRGDGLEGTLAYCSRYDIEHIKDFNEKYCSTNVLNSKNRPILHVNEGRRIYFKDKRSLELPCFCIYIMKHSLFPCPESPGHHKITAEISSSYFRDFSDNSLPEDVEALPLEDQPALIIISNFQEFQNRLYAALKNLGLDDTEIILGTVAYYDFEEFGPNGWRDFGQKYPYELLAKNIRFANQSEARIIINTVKKDVIKRLYDAPLELGSMNDIAQVHKGYLHGGVQVGMTVLIEEE